MIFYQAIKGRRNMIFLLTFGIRLENMHTGSIRTAYHLPLSKLLESDYHMSFVREKTEQ